MKPAVVTLFTLFFFFQCRSQDLYPFKDGYLYGYRDIKGEVKIEPQFQYATEFSWGIAVVVKYGWAGAIDKNNQVVVPFRFQFLEVLDSLDLFYGFRGKKMGEHIVGVIGWDGRIKVPAEYNSIRKYNNTYTVTKDADSIIRKEEFGAIVNSHGLYDSEGKVLIPCKYDDLAWVSESLIAVDSAYLPDSASSLQKRSALFNKSGQMLSKFEYRLIGKFKDGIAIARKDKYGFIDSNGDIVIPMQFDYCEQFSHGYALVMQKGKWGAIDRNGKIIVQPNFDHDRVNSILKR